MTAVSGKIDAFHFYPFPPNKHLHMNSPNSQCPSTSNEYYIAFRATLFVSVFSLMCGIVLSNKTHHGSTICFCISAFFAVVSIALFAGYRMMKTVERQRENERLMEANTIATNPMQMPNTS